MDEDKLMNEEIKNKPSLSNTIIKWVDNSSTKRIVVATFSSIAFLLGLGMASWTAYKEYIDETKNPEIRLRSYELGATMRWITVGQHLGMQGATETQNIFTMGAEVPTFAVSFEIRNPTKNRMTLTDCSLLVRYHGEANFQQSDTNLSPQSIRDHSVESPLAIIIDPGTTTIIERVFGFNQMNMDKLTDVKRNIDREFKIVCLTESKTGIETPWSAAAL